MTKKQKAHRGWGNPAAAAPPMPAAAPEPAPTPSAVEPLPDIDGPPDVGPVPDPGVIYAVYAGPIDGNMSPLFAHNFSILTNSNLKYVHLLLQSLGGFVGDGVFMYNVLRSAPFGVTVYNSGQVASAGAIAYLGCQHRVASRFSAFMLHRAQMAPPFSNSTKLQRAADVLIWDDERTSAIIRENTALTDEMWHSLEHHDITLSGEDAVKYGIAHEVGEFAPPLGTKLFDLLYAKG
jgi:ATP-dependent protease ClpP protease subunit